jgi:hypothetical protein
MSLLSKAAEVSLLTLLKSEDAGKKFFMLFSQKT